jgi:flagellar protein FliL
MSAAAAAADAAEVAPKKGKKKLIILIAAVVALLGIGGGGAVVYVKKKAAAEAAAAEEDEDGEGASTGHKAVAKEEQKKVEKRTPPVFVPLEPFVVNLADREADRFAQVGITLEVADAHVGDEIKAYMPAIRNNVLLLLAHKTSEELMEPEGKEEAAKHCVRWASTCPTRTRSRPARRKRRRRPRPKTKKPRNCRSSRCSSRPSSFNDIGLCHLRADHAFAHGH